MTIHDESVATTGGDAIGSSASKNIRFMAEKLSILQRQVDTLQTQLGYEKREREALQKYVIRKLRESLPDISHEELRGSPPIMLEDEHLRGFHDVGAILEAAEISSNPESNDSRHTPTVTASKRASGSDCIEGSLINGQKAGLVGLEDLPTNTHSNTNLTTPYLQGMISSQVLRDCDQEGSGEDITSLINDAMAQNLRKRTLSNEFLISQPHRSRSGSGIEVVHPMGYMPNLSLRNMPIFPLRINTPSTPNNNYSSAPPTPTSQLGEHDIMEKWGIRFSEKYATISDVWNEYHKIGAKGVSIRSLEQSFSNRWRSNLHRNVKKKYSRRLIIIRAIETGIKRGKSLEECIGILEDFLRQANKPISHLYRKANLPPEFT
ncbi:LAQU0S04e03554g1_1 [Lachancea quebecensis]|uniref:LAQU0S04e03554g1_1 n=1 Tax=Lachancea quebecensis TaxID=1654605 RepID=A0A0P1KSK4_9SACH|nr:LAQU0S04e03554g1_1 [Lachancea quebecensis]